MELSSPVTWSNVNKALEEGTPSDMKEVLSKLKWAPVHFVYETLTKFWRDQELEESISLILDWGEEKHKFALIRYCFIRSEDQHDEQEVNEGQQETEKSFTETITKRILQLHPLVVKEVVGQGTEKGKNLLHYIVKYNSEDLLQVVLGMFKDPKDPEALLVSSKGVNDSPLVMLIKHGKLRMLETILRSLPSLEVDESILTLAINQKQNEILLALATHRPDCIIVDLVKYCITWCQGRILDVIPAARREIFFNHGILDYAVRSGNESMIKLLLNKYPDLAMEIEFEKSPLHSLQQDDVKARLNEKKREEIRSVVLPYIIRGANGLSPTDGSGRVPPIDQIRALLADPEGKEVSLDLGGFRHSSRSIYPFLKMIEGFSGGMKPIKQKPASLLTVEFEADLRYVDIPIPAFPRPDIPTKFIPERVEAARVLGWLRDSKAVTGIYELRVRDSLYLPHTEETIKSCLDGFDVEVLDWMRVNMSARPLVTTCPKLKRLTLYVSTWATLSYWVSGEGYEELSKLDMLREVEIFILADLVGSSYGSTYEQDCRECEKNSQNRLAMRVPAIDIKFTMNFSLRSWSSLVARHEEAAIAKQSTAVDVTHLGAYIEAYCLLQKECEDPEFLMETGTKFPETAEKGFNLSPIVNVAVIDTGVDPDSIQCYEISGASFVSSESGESPWWFSYHPHGTQMAKIITELNPHCRLLVAKVGDSVMDMTVDRMIRALKWAVKSKADIISISAAFFKKNPKLETAIHDTVGADIVVIASTAGEGHLQEEAYPANYDQVLKIAATDYRGRETAESLQSRADFMLPGENIVAKTTFLGSDNPTNEVSGTSVSTAIASGVASLVLASHRLSLSKQKSLEPWQSHKKLKRKLVINAFKQMIADNTGKFVKPWLFFGGSGDQHSWGEARSTLDWLSRKEFPI